MKRDLTRGGVTASLLVFAAPMILGNLMQQFYNLADTWVVGRFVGANALAAVGSAYTLMTFLNSILIGLCMGSGALLSFYCGAGERQKLYEGVQASFWLIGGLSVALCAVVQLAIDPILYVLRIPDQLYAMMREYVFVVFWGIFFVFLYNYFSFVLRALGNSVVPLYFLAAASVLNVGLDLLFVVVFDWSLQGAAWATVIAQAVSGIGLGVYTALREPELRVSAGWLCRRGKKPFGTIFRFSAAACAQQSVMNFGILLVQGLVNSFGASVMAAFAAAVKIDTFAYMPAQEFGNAYSIFISQNYGAARTDRIRLGTRRAVQVSFGFCLAVSALVFVFAAPLMTIFVDPSETYIIGVGVQYLRIEGAFYVGIGLLFLLYGYFRGVNRPQISLLLTIVSLGTRVVLAYALAPLPAVGVAGIWAAVPIGWFLADIVGFALMRRTQKKAAAAR